MSIAVPLDQLADEVAQRGFGYLVTVADDGRPHAVALRPALVGPPGVPEPVFEFVAGATTCRNAAARPAVTVVFPPCAADEFSLLVDGVASVDDDRIRLRPTWAVRHRPAP